MIERIYEARNRAFSLLENKRLDTGAIQLVLQAVTGKSHASLLADLREPLTENQHRLFWEQVDELLTGKPVQYVLGTEMFYGRIFKVNENVLIPRPETEELIYETLNRLPRLFGNRPLTVADIGTGSGAIAVTMKKEWPTASVTATDISVDALTVAKQNAEELGASITFQQGDLAEPLMSQKWDVILSNPPYIAISDKDIMAETVTAYEPDSALFADEDGLYCYKRLAESLPLLMNKPALIGVEIGHEQGEAVHKLFTESFPTADIEIKQDINGKDRMLFCEISE